MSRSQDVFMSKRQTVKEIDKRLYKNLGRIVKITWGDAHGSHFADNAGYMTQLCEIESVGWMIYEDKDVVTIAAFKNANYTIDQFEELKDKYRYYIVIPRKTIWRVRGL